MARCSKCKHPETPKKYKLHKWKGCLLCPTCLKQARILTGEEARTPTPKREAVVTDAELAPA